MDVTDKDGAGRCTEVASTKMEYALNSDKFHPSVVSSQPSLISESEPNEESEGIEDDLQIENFDPADEPPVIWKTIQPTSAGAPRNEPSKKRMASAKGPAPADVLPFNSETIQLTGAGAPTTEPPKKRMASAIASRTEGLEKRWTGAIDAGLMLLLILIGGVSSEIHDLRIYGGSKLFEGEELRLFCAGCGVPGCSWYYGGYEEENMITDGISYTTYGMELLISNMSTQLAGSYICQKKVDHSDSEMMPVKVLPRVPDLKIFGPTRVMVGEVLKLACLSGTEAYLSISVNGTEIHSGEKYELEPISGYGKMELRLLVANVSMDDGGTYECIQDNDPDKRALLDIKIIPDLASPPEEKSNAKCGFGPSSTILLVVCVMLASLVIVLCVYHSCKGGRRVETNKEYPPYYIKF